MNRFCRFAAPMLVLGFSACGGGGGNQVSALGCADVTSQNQRTSVKGIRPGMTIADAQTLLRCEHPEAQLSLGQLTIPPNGDAPHQEYRVFTTSALAPQTRLYALFRRVRYNESNTIPTDRSRQELEARYGPFRLFERPIGPYETKRIFYSRLDGNPGDAADLPLCAQAVDSYPTLEVTGNAHARIVEPDMGGLANCGIMMFIQRGDLQNGTVVNVDMLIVDFPLLARLERERQGDQNRQSEAQRQRDLNQAEERFRRDGSDL